MDSNENEEKRFSLQTLGQLTEEVGINTMEAVIEITKHLKAAMEDSLGEEELADCLIEEKMNSKEGNDAVIKRRSSNIIQHDESEGSIAGIERHRATTAGHNIDDKNLNSLLILDNVDFIEPSAPPANAPPTSFVDKANASEISWPAPNDSVITMPQQIMQTTAMKKKKSALSSFFSKLFRKN